MADVEFEDFSIKVKNAIADITYSALEEAAGELKSQVINNSRVGQPGAPTKNSWKHKVVESENAAYIGSSYENAIWEEFGTGEYALNNNGRKGAWYVPVEEVVGYKKPTYKGKVIIINGKNGQKFYKTNGKKPSRAFWNAYIALKPKIISLIQNKFKGL